MSDTPKPRVGICLPSHDMVHKSHAIALASMCAVSTNVAKLALFDKRGSIIHMSRNDLVQMTRDFGCDYLLWCDSDMEFPPDTLARLLAWNVDIVGCLYQKREPPFDTVGRLAAHEKGRDLDDTKKLFEADLLSGGLVLVKASVYEKIGFPWYDIKLGAKVGEGEGEDYYWSRRCKEEGFKLWVDMGLSYEVAHFGQRRVVIGKPDAGDAASVGMVSAA